MVNARRAVINANDALRAYRRMRFTSVDGALGLDFSERGEGPAVDDGSGVRLHEGKVFAR
jgi:hypothetical protein